MRLKSVAPAVVAALFCLSTGAFAQAPVGASTGTPIGTPPTPGVIGTTPGVVGTPPTTPGVISTTPGVVGTPPSLFGTPSSITGTTPSIIGTPPSIFGTPPLDSNFGNSSSGATGGFGSPTAPIAPPVIGGPRICPNGMTVC